MFQNSSSPGKKFITMNSVIKHKQLIHTLAVIWWSVLCLYSFFTKPRVSPGNLKKVVKIFLLLLNFLQIIKILWNQESYYSLRKSSSSNSHPLEWWNRFWSISSSKKLICLYKKIQRADLILSWWTCFLKLFCESIELKYTVIQMGEN